MTTDGRTIPFVRDGERHLALVIDGEAEPRKNAMTITDEDGSPYAVSIPLGAITGSEAKYLATPYPAMLCAHCEREVETHESGLCDSCEQQARYEAVSASPGERIAAVLEEVGVDPSIRDEVRDKLVELGIDFDTTLVRQRRRRYLVATFDVTDLDEEERDALAGEVHAQAERSEGHPSVSAVLGEATDSGKPTFVGYFRSEEVEGNLVSVVIASGEDPIRG
jgi:hypothetical protein